MNQNNSRNSCFPSVYYDLAHILVDHSTDLKPGEKVLIQAAGCDTGFMECLIGAVYEKGALPFVKWGDARIGAAQMRGASDELFALMGKHEAALMEQMDAFIGVRGGDNIFESSDVPADRMQAYTNLVAKPVHFEIRVPKTKWVILRWPTPGMAQQAKMSTAAFEKFYFDACTVNYKQMGERLQPLVDLMERTDKVRIKGPGETDLSFRIGGIPAIPCSGERNIPDGECFTAPVRESVTGVIAYNTPTVYEGKDFRNLRLEFKEGCIVSFSAESGDAAELAEIFNRDEGARYVGEFALGVNHQIQVPMQDILFDEKIAGSLHFTPGQAYDIADNGNRSTIHWDLVLMQNPASGGGEIYFDDVLIRKDGLFVAPELADLNPATWQA